MAQDERIPIVDTDYSDVCKLMQQLSRMANMEWSPVKRMILVLDVDDIPRLFVEGFLEKRKVEEELSKGLHPVNLTVSEEPVIVSVEGMQGHCLNREKEYAEKHKRK